MSPGFITGDEKHPPSSTPPHHNSSLRHLIRLLLSDPKLTWKAVAFQILQALSFIPFTAGVGWFVDEVLLKERGWPWVLGYALANLLWWPVHAWFTVKAYACTQMMVRIAVARLRRMTVDKLQSMSISFFTRQGAGALSNKVTVDIGRVETFFNHVTNNLVVGLAIGLGTFVYLLWLNWVLAMLSLVLVPLQIGLIKWMQAKLHRLNKRVQSAGEDFSARMVEFVAGIRLTKSFGNEEMVAARLAQTIEHLKTAGYDASIATRWLLMWLQMASQYMPVIIWGVGAILFWNQQVTMGQLVAFVGLLVFIQGAINALIASYEQWLPARPGADAIMEILESSELEDLGQHRSKIKLRGQIELRDVSFCYPGAEIKALDQINLIIPAGQRVGLVGETGAGKSTFLDLILGFYQPTHGTILWDGHRLSEIGCLQLRRATAIMSQDAFLWNDTVRENIRFGRANATEAEVEQAARQAQAHEFITQLEHGYDTLCGERGSKLSGGQRQRIALARVFLRNPAIVVLDEPTSALDVETEARLQKDLDEMCQGRTTFIVAHRLSTLRSVDRILVFSQGRIIEDGSLTELLSKPEGHFKRLHSLQGLRPALEDSASPS